MNISGGGWIISVAAISLISLPYILLRSQTPSFLLFSSGAAFVCRQSLDHPKAPQMDQFANFEGGSQVSQTLTTLRHLTPLIGQRINLSVRRGPR